MTRIKAELGAHPVLAFATLAYAISWSFWLPLLAARQGWVRWSGSTYLHLWGGLGPAAAALIVTGVVDGRAGITALLRSIWAWRGRLWYREHRLLESTTDLGPTTRGTYGPAISPLLLQGWSSTSHMRGIAMHNEIVVGLEDSPSGRAALEWAVAEAIRSRAVLRAVHALSWPFGVEHADGVLAGRQLSRAEVDVAYRASITRVFDAIRPRPDWIIQFAHGDPGRVLVRQSEKATALVIGTPSHVGLGRLLIGSVAQYCVGHASCPVVAVPPALAANVAQNPGPVLDRTTALASA